jgi:hypothetical protein
MVSDRTSWTTLQIRTQRSGDTIAQKKKENFN